MSKWKPYFLRKRNVGDPIPWVRIADGGEHDGWSCMMVTISPDPELYSDGQIYRHMDPSHQILIIKQVIHSICYIYGGKVKYLNGSFEMNQDSNVHYHGTWIVHPNSSTAFWAVKLGKFVSKKLGRPKLAWYICCKIDCNDDLDKWNSYIYKDSIEVWNGQLGARFHKHFITDFLHEMEIHGHNLN